MAGSEGDRAIVDILAEWRAAEAKRRDSVVDPELEARIDALRLEYAGAVDALQDEANELGEPRRR